MIAPFDALDAPWILAPPVSVVVVKLDAGIVGDDRAAHRHIVQRQRRIDRHRAVVERGIGPADAVDLAGAGNHDGVAIVDGAILDLGAVKRQHASAVDLDGVTGIGRGVVEQRRRPAHFQRTEVGDRTLRCARCALDLGAAGQSSRCRQARAGIVGDDRAAYRDIVQRQRRIDASAALVPLMPSILLAPATTMELPSLMVPFLISVPSRRRHASAVDLDGLAGIGQGVVKQRRGAAHFQRTEVGDRTLRCARCACGSWRRRSA